MAKGSPTAANNDQFDSPDRILQMTLAANQIAGAGPPSNAYEMRNALLETRRVARVRYKNGITLPASAAMLRTDAERKARHSRILERNVRKATGIAKHPEADTHHVVAQCDRRASKSREILFNWGIGINDADNGVHMPRKWTSKVPGLENATAHENIHTDEYHFAIYDQLFDVRRATAAEGRSTLREIKSEILENSFIY